MEEYTLSRPSDEPGIQLNTIMENSDIKSRFEKEFSTRSDYFNHRLGLFMDMANWIEKQLAELRAELEKLKADNERLKEELQKAKTALRYYTNKGNHDVRSDEY